MMRAMADAATQQVVVIGCTSTERSALERLEATGEIQRSEFRDLRDAKRRGMPSPTLAIVGCEVDRETLDFCAALRENRIPFLLIGRDGSPESEDLAIVADADAFLGRPVRSGQLILCVRALMRRASGVFSQPLHVGPVFLDRDRGYASAMGRRLDLEPDEFEVLAFMLEHQGAVVSADELAHRVLTRVGPASSRPGGPSDQDVRSVISRLWAKLGSSRDVLRQQWGKGFVIVPFRAARFTASTGPAAPSRAPESDRPIPDSERYFS